MKKKWFLLILILYAIKSEAQLKVGNNPKIIQSNTNFQVESSTGNQFVITKDSSKVGIGTLTPAASLDVIGKVKITDGTEGNGKVLVSDANGKASWQNASSIQSSSTDSTTASNGLTLSGKDVQLGGTLTKATTITTSATNTIAFSGLQSGAASDSILVSNPSTGVIKRISPAILGAATEPWFNAATNAGATANTQNIYQMGKVGINVNNPTEQLEVNGNIFQRGYTFIRKATGNSGAFIWTNFNSGGDAINYSFNYHNADGTNTIPNSGYTTNSIVQQNGGIYFKTSDGQVNQAPTLNAMMISPAGRVGINTVSPSTQLHIIDSTGNGPLRLDGLQSGASTDSILVAVPSTGVVKRIAPATLGAATEPWYSSTTLKGATLNTENIYQMGNVGVGTNSPQANIHISAPTGNSKLFVEQTGTGGNIGQAGVDLKTATQYWRIINQSAPFGNRLDFYNQTNPSYVMTLSSSNNVGIGNVSPTYKLDVSGKGRFTDTLFGTKAQFNNLASGSANDSIVTIDANGNLLRRSQTAIASTSEPWFNAATNAGATANTQNIYQMGRVGININNPSEQLDVNGNILQRGYTFIRKVTGNSSAFIWTNFNSGGDAINYSFNYHNADGTNTIPNTGYTTNSIIQQNAGIYFRTSNGVNGAIPSLNAMAITTSGRVGVNTVSPSTQLHIIDSTGNGPLRLDGLQSGSIATDSVLVATNTGVVKQISIASLSNGAIVGDIKQGLQAADHSGWIKLDGRLKSTLSTSQQANATSLGIGTNLPNATNTYLSQNGTTLGSVSGSNTRTIAQNQLPNVTLSGTTASNGDHFHSTTISSQNDGVDDGNYSTSVQRGDNGNITTQTWNTNTTGAHTHTFTTSSINGNVTQQTIDIKPQTLSVNVFIYLGN